MGWGDGAWGDGGWGGVLPLSASGVGRGTGTGSTLNLVTQLTAPGGGQASGVGSRLSVVAALNAAGSAIGTGTAEILKTPVGLSASGRGVGRGTASFTDMWFLGGVAFAPAEITFDAETLTLTTQADGQQLAALRGLGTAGDIEVTSGFGGQFRATDRSGAGGGAVSLQPSIETTPATEPAEVLLSGLSEADLGAGAPRDVDIELQRRTNRSEAYPPISQSGDVELDLAHGTVGLDERSVGLIDREQTPTGTSASLSLLVSATQLGALADSWGYPSGVVERSVPDGEDRLVDDSPAATQTATLSTAAGVGLDLDDGEYIVREWSASHFSQNESHRYEIELTLQPKP